MNPQRLLQHFETISDAPDAVEKLRRLVLDLAVRGKLLEKGAASNWNPTNLGSVGEWGSGSTPPRSDAGLYGGGITWLKSGELGDNRALRGSSETITEKALTTGSFRKNKPGDVLIAMYGATIGKLAILAEPAVTNQAVCGCTPHPSLSNEYLFLFLLAHREAFKAASEGGAQPNISKAKILATPIALPPLDEQHRIVAKVDELMALCDQLDAARTRREATRDRLAAASLARLNTPDPTTFTDDACFALDTLPALTSRDDQVKQLRQTILSLAVRGKLLPHDATGCSETTKALAKARPQNTPFPIPSTWSWRSLGSIGKLKGGGTPSKARDDFWGGDIPWVSPKDMKVDYISASHLSITPAAIEGSPVSTVAPSSVLFVVRGMILAHSFPVAVTTREVTINQDMKALEPTNPGWSEYLLRALKGLKPEMLAKVQRSSHGTCRLEGADYRDFLVPIPPLSEQHRIVAKVDELMALCDQLEATLTHADTIRRRLLDSLLHEALAPALEAAA